MFWEINTVVAMFFSSHWNKMCVFSTQGWWLKWSYFRNLWKLSFFTCIWCFRCKLEQMHFRYFSWSLSANCIMIDLCLFFRLCGKNLHMLYFNWPTWVRVSTRKPNSCNCSNPTVCKQCQFWCLISFLCPHKWDLKTICLGFVIGTI